MARTCLTCRHPGRAAIDAEMVAHAPFRAIAGRYGLARSSLMRHHDEHLGELLAKAEQAGALEADALLARLQRLLDTAEGLLARAARDGDYRTALAGVGQARACYELLLEVSGRVDRRPTLNLLLAPQWIEARTALLDALQPFPQAREAVSVRLVALEAG